MEYLQCMRMRFNFLCSPTACLKWSVDRIKWSKSLAKTSVVESPPASLHLIDELGQDVASMVTIFAES
jgi:hypothetical protein